MRLKLLAAVLTAVLAAGPPALADCQLRNVAEFPVTMAGGSRPLIRARINGKEAQFLLDTGAFYSTLTAPGAAKLGVRTLLNNKVDLAGVGGEARAHVGMADSFDIGGVSAEKVEFIVVPDPDLRLDEVGVIGMNVLQSSDLELDLAHGVARFFRPVGCERADLGYWAAGKANVLDLLQGWMAHPPLVSHAKVGGRSVTVLFDTGASRSVLARTAAGAAGVPLSGPGVTPAGRIVGVGHRTVETFTAPVTSFTLGGETIRNTRLRIAPVDLPQADMLLGADFFLSHRVYVSQGQHRMFFTYNGGPVFQLDDRPPPPPAPEAPADKAAAPSG